MKLQITELFLVIYYISTFFEELQCRPQGSFVVTTTQSSSKVDEVETPQPPPKIVDVDIRSDIQFRYAKTVVKTYIKNPSISNAQKVKFNMVLPSTAFISNFTIQIIGKDEVYVAKVAKKEEAKKAFDEAVDEGKSAGIVDADTRDANQITITSNLEAASKMLFTLTYEELLKRHISKYEHIIHVNPGQIVKNFNVDVFINESLPVISINVPALKTDPNEITSQLKENNVVKIERNIDGNPNGAHIQFSPTPEEQKEMARLSKRKQDGMSGQFIVQYDVDRKNEENEVQVLDGYFVHFFAPDQLEVMPRHVVFVLDVSGSMHGVKLDQTKDAMVTVLDDLTDQDYFNILTFSDDVYHWSPKKLQIDEANSNPGPLNLTYQGSESIRKEALKYVLDLDTIGGTNINDGLLEALNVIEKVRVSESVPFNVKPIIIFLTDGQATTGTTDNKAIKKNVLEGNEELNAPIYGLAFGNGADFSLLKDIGKESGAFSRRIYEASDAAIQLEYFYQEIASPLLSNVTFDYVGESFQNKTNKKFNTFFKGGEYVIAGKLDNIVDEENEVEIIVSGVGKESKYKKIIARCATPLTRNISEIGDHSNIKRPCLCCKPCIPWPGSPKPVPTLPQPSPTEPKSNAENFIERLWAFLTIENLLNEKRPDANDNNQGGLKADISETPNEEKALELALKYNFVTKLTSLFVVKPDDEKPSDENDSSSGTPVNPQSVSLTRPNFFGGPQSFKSAIQSFKFKSAAGGSNVRLRSPPSPHRRRRPSLNRSSISPSILTSLVSKIRPSAGLSAGLLSSDMASTNNFGGGGLRASAAAVPFSGQSFDMDGAEDNISTTTEEVDLSIAQCTLNLFEKTYLRGDSITLVNPSNSTVNDLSQFLFDDKLASLEVVGPCCWQVFEDANHVGKHKMFSEGKYKSSTKLGSSLTKEASSVLVTTC